MNVAKTIVIRIGGRNTCYGRERKRKKNKDIDGIGGEGDCKNAHLLTGKGSKKFKCNRSPAGGAARIPSY